MKKLVIFIVLLLTAKSALAEVYRWVDKNGKVHYSDEPPKNKQAEKVELQELIGYKNENASVSAPKLDSTQKAKKYKKCNITSPKNDEIIRGHKRNVTINWTCPVKLQEGHAFRVKLDGKAVSTSRSQAFTVKDVALGAHKVSVEIVSEKGKRIKTVGGVTFTALLPLKRN